jgi:hypothetical protein
MPAFYLNQIPGYREALHRARGQEFRTREDNWLALSGSIAGQPVRVMTVRDYVGLLRIQSPFLVRREPSFEDLGKFLWLLSPQIERWHNHTGWRKPWLVGCRWSLFSIERWQLRLAAKRLRRRLKMRQLENTARAWNQANPGKLYVLPDDSALAQAFTEAFAYLDRVFLDRPAGLAKEGLASGLLYLTSWFDAIQSEYHKTDDEVYKMPLPQLFGRLKAMQLRNSPGEPDFNARQDALAAQIQRAIDSRELTPEDVLAGKLKFQSN